MVSFAFQEFSKRRNRYLPNVFVIGLVVFMIITLNALAIAYQDAAQLPFASVHSTIMVQKSGNVPENITGVVLPCSLAPIQSGATADTRKLDGVSDVSTGLFLWVFDTDSFKRVLGVNWGDTLGNRVQSKLIAGALPGPASDVLVEQTYADQYGLSVNQTMTISGTPFRISGIVASSGKDLVSSDVYMDIAPAQVLAYNSPNLQATEPFLKNDVNILFVDTDPVKTKEVAEQLKVLFTDGTNVSGGKTPTGQTIGTYSISSSDTFEDQVSAVFLLSDRLAVLLSVIIIVAGAVIIGKNMSHLFLERWKEFGVMKTVGWTRRDVQKEVLAETFLQVGIGGAGGIVASVIAIYILAMTTVSISIPWDLNPYPHFLTATPDLGATVQTYPLPITFPVLYAVIAIGVVVTVGAATAFFLVRRLNTMKPMEVLKYE